MGRKKKIIKYAMDGKEVAIFESVALASSDCGKSTETMRRCLRGLIPAINGFKYAVDENSIKEKENPQFDFKCPYCERSFKSYNGLANHVLNGSSHKGISKVQLLTDYKYDGKRPTCKCGCGRYTNINNLGGSHFEDFCQGHQSVVKNNWGHNSTAVKHSADTRRRQYKSGERIQWNKGKKWTEVFSKEKINELLLSYGSLHKRIKSGKFSLSSKLEDNFIKNYISIIGVKYERQWFIKEIRQFCDVYFPETNTVLEINGDFWHANPNMYKTGPKYKCQIDRIAKDKIKYDYLKNHDISLIVIWEHDIVNSIDSVKKIINEQIANAKI